MKNHYRQLKIQGGLLLCVAIFSLPLLTVSNGKAASASADYPTRPIDVVTHAAPGDNLDILVRLIVDIINQEKLLSQPMAVVNKRGAGGGVAFSYVWEQKGNPHVILIVSSSGFLLLPLVENIPYNYKSFVPICNVAVDANVLLVRTDSPFKTVGDLFAEAKKSPNKLIQGGGSYVGVDGALYQRMMQATGAQWKFISFAGGSPETLVNILNGNIDFTIMNPGGMRDYAKAGKVRVLLNCSTERYPQFKNAPTMQEAGVGEPIMVHRVFVGGPNMPDYVVRKLEPILKKAAESDRFKKFLTDSMLIHRWMSSNEVSKFLSEESVRFEKIVPLLKK